MRTKNKYEIIRQSGLSLLELKEATHKDDVASLSHFSRLSNIIDYYDALDDLV